MKDLWATVIQSLNQQMSLINRLQSELGAALTESQSDAPIIRGPWEEADEEDQEAQEEVATFMDSGRGPAREANSSTSREGAAEEPALLPNRLLLLEPPKPETREKTTT